MRYYILLLFILLSLFNSSCENKQKKSATLSIYSNRDVAFTMEEISDAATDEILAEVNAIRRERGYQTLEKDLLMNFSAKRYSARNYEPLDSLEKLKFINLDKKILYEKKTLASEDKLRMLQYLLNIANEVEASIEEYEKKTGDKVYRWGAGFYTADGNEWYFTFVAN